MRVVNRKRRHLSEEETQVGATMVFQPYGQPLETVTSFKYLRSLLTALGDDLPAIIIDLHKAQKIWSHLSSILGREVSDPITSGFFTWQ